MSSSSTGSISRTASSQSTVIFRENLGLSVKLESLPGLEPNIPDPYDENCIESHTNEKEDSPSLLTLAKHVFFRLSQKEKTNWSPTPIQLQTWPILNQGLNVMAIATTGSGKTLSYAIPMVHSCMEKGVVAGNRPSIHGLVLVPTRELAIQVSKTMKIVCKSANKLSGRKDMAALAIYGGVDREEQIDSLLLKKEGVAPQYIIAATTMRLIDILGITFENEERTPNNRVRALFEQTKFVAVDEADRIATQVDLTQQAQAVLDFVKSKSSCLDQYCLFSATLPQKAMSKCNEWVNLPRVTVKVNTVTVGSKLPDVDKSKEEKSATSTMGNSENKNDAQQEKEERAAKRRGPMDVSTIPAHITQTLHVCSNHKKPKKLCATIKQIRDGENKEGNRRRKGLIIIFFGRIKTLQYMHKLLLKEGVQGVQFHSKMNQQQRESQLNSFRCGKTPILLATDIAARGLHCNNVEYIINYDFPGSLEQVSFLDVAWYILRMMSSDHSSKFQYVHRCGRAGRNKVSAADGKEKQLNAVVYSFFNRELAPMAKDVIDLLKSSNSWIDQNLISLVPGGVDGCESKRKKRRKDKNEDIQEPSINEDAKVEDAKVDEIQVGNGDSDDEFAFLVQNRIVLERASHVKDDSDSD